MHQAQGLRSIDTLYHRTLRLTWPNPFAPLHFMYQGWLAFSLLPRTRPLGRLQTRLLLLAGTVVDGLRAGVTLSEHASQRHPQTQTHPYTHTPLHTHTPNRVDIPAHKRICSKPRSDKEIGRAHV